jgi:drug/metabolite transporter (DMT)-like permease
MTIPLSVLCGLLSMFAYGLANVFSKPLSQKLGAPQTLFLRSFTILLILIIASIPTYHYLSHWQMAVAAIGLGMGGYLPVLAYTQSIKESPLGIIAPIAGSSPLVTVVLSCIFLNVALNSGQWIAVVLIMIANVTVSIDFKNWRQSRFLRMSSGIPLAVAAAIGWGLFYFFLVPVTRTMSPWLAALLVEVGVMLASGLHIRYSAQTVSLKQALQPTVIINGIFICLGTVAFTVGVRYYNVGVVAALANSTALIATILGVYLFHEKLRTRDRLAAAVMIASVAALSLL